MYLNKRSLIKITAATVVYAVLAVLSLIVTVYASFAWGLSVQMFIITAFLFAMIPTVYFWGRWSEGCGKHINKANKLVMSELKPAEFIKYYDAVKNDVSLVESDPSIDLLQYLAVAYDAMGDVQRSLDIADSILMTCPPAKQTLAKLIKLSYLYGANRTDEAEVLFDEVGKLKMKSFCKVLYDTIINTDRAKALGDYKLCEAYYMRILNSTFPKQSPMVRLVAHYDLASIYEMTQRSKEALEHYRYCADMGGETAIRSKAAEAVSRLEQILQ